MVQPKKRYQFGFPICACKIIPVKWFVLIFVLFRQASILDLPRHYAEQGDIKSAIRAYSEIYRTSQDSIINYQALFEQSRLFLRKGDTISAIANLYKLSQRFLPDSLARGVFKLLFSLDKSRLGSNAITFASLYPDVSGRKRILSDLLKELSTSDDTVSYLKILKLLASDYGGDYKKMLSEFVYKNNMENRVFPILFEANAEAPYFYYIHKGDTFSAFYTLYGREDLKSRKLRLKILYGMGAYEACSRMISNNEKDPDLVKMKVLSLVKMRVRADSIVNMVKSYRTYRKLYRSLMDMLDTIRDYGLLRSYLRKDVVGALLSAQGASEGLRDTVFFELAKFLTVQGKYGFAKEIIDKVEKYYPMDTLLLWKEYLDKKRRMPQDILLSHNDAVTKVKELFENGYYAELVNYARGRELPRRVVPYITESLYMLWKLYGRRGYLNSAIKLADKYKSLIPRKLYIKIVYDYCPSNFDLERYTYDNLSAEELYYLYFLLKAQGKNKLIKDFSQDRVSRFLYFLSLTSIDSALHYLPSNQIFYPLLFSELQLKTEDSFKVFRKLSKTALDYKKYPAKSILRHIIPIAQRFNDFLACDTLLNIYRENYGKDRFYIFHRAELEFSLEDYKKSLLYSLFFPDDSFQSLTALSLLKLNRIEGISNLTLNRYARNLLYLKSGMLDKVNPDLLDNEDVLQFIKALENSKKGSVELAEVLEYLLNKGKIDSMTYVAYGVYLGILNKDSVYLNRYGESLLKYLFVKRLMRMNLLDSALIIIGDPDNAVDSLKYHLFFKKGTILYLKKRYREAYLNYEKAAKLESLKDAALYNAYLAAKRGNMQSKAIEALKSYITDCTKCEKLPDAYISLGFSYIESGRPDSAIFVLEKVEGYLESEQEAELKYWLGMAFMQDSLFKPAAGYFLRVYRFHQKDGQWGDTGGLNAARLCYILGLEDEAKKIYASIVKRRKNDALAQQAKKEMSMLK